MKDKILASADLSVTYTRYTLTGASEKAGEDQNPPSGGGERGGRSIQERSAADRETTARA